MQHPPCVVVCRRAKGAAATVEDVVHQPAPMMTIAELTAFLDQEFPQLLDGGRCFFVESVYPGGAAMRFVAGSRHLRPGGTVSGPSMMALADLIAYVAILAQIGPVALAVTTNLSINFLRMPAPGDLVAEGRILKLGQRLAVVDCSIRAAETYEVVAHAAVTYSLPPCTL
jgi:uncharacterized protein (TIGR00369 family)